MLERLKADSIFGKMKMTEVENGILLNSGTTWKSWGENIEITLESNEDVEFIYHLSSRSRVSATLIDYGKNLVIENNTLEVMINFNLNEVLAMVDLSTATDNDEDCIITISSQD